MRFSEAHGFTCEGRCEVVTTVWVRIVRGEFEKWKRGAK